MDEELHNLIEAEALEAESDTDEAELEQEAAADEQDAVDVAPVDEEAQSAIDQAARMDAYSARVRKYLAKNMDDLLGDAAVAYEECPFCNFYNTPGWLHASPCPPELLGTVYAWTNVRAPDEYKRDTAAHACDGCDGLGSVLTGSKVEGQDRLPCTVCNGRGWLAVGPERQGGNIVVPNGPAPLYPPAVDSSQPAVEASMNLSPEAEAAKRQGYIVIPMTGGAS